MLPGIALRAPLNESFAPGGTAQAHDQASQEPASAVRLVLFGQAVETPE
jgi:hypothetical protein